MVSDEIKLEVRQAWFEYGKAVVEGFGFPRGSQITADGLEELLAASTEEGLRDFLERVRSQTKELRSMRYVGE